MAGEHTVSGHITWKQQAGSVLQQRKIFRSSLTTRRSHFIWPAGCGQCMDTFPTVRLDMLSYICRLLPLTLFSNSLTNLTLDWLLLNLFLVLFLPSPFSRFFLLSSLTSSCFCLPPPHPFSLTFPFKLSHSLPLSPSFSLCLWSVTLNLAPSICFSSFV